MAKLAYLAGVGFQELILVLLFPVIFIGILLLLRVFFLWYWKVNTIVKNQEIQIKLLSDLLLQTKAGVKSDIPPEGR